MILMNGGSWFCGSVVGIGLDWFGFGLFEWNVLALAVLYYLCILHLIYDRYLIITIIR